MQSSSTHTEQRGLSIAQGGLDESLFTMQTRIGISSSPYSDAALARTIAHAEVALERAFMLARIQASSLAVVELFALLVENAAEMLPDPWSTVLDLIAAEERFWVYPSANVGDIEDGLSPAFVPHLDRAALATEWNGLLEHAQRVSDARSSSAQHGLEA